MNRKINVQLLKYFKKEILLKPSPLFHTVYEHSYKSIESFLEQISRPFHNVCIHGDYAHMGVQIVRAHNRRLNVMTQKLTISNYTLNSDELTDTDMINNKENINNKLNNEIKNETQNQINDQTQDAKRKHTNKIRYYPLQTAQMFLFPPNSFDLIISLNELHHTNDTQRLLSRYETALEADGALLGCAVGEGTLKELHWAYLMGENERSGGISPKVSAFSSLGVLGHQLTASHLQLCNVFAEEIDLEFQSLPHLLTFLQQLGETAFHRGRRKGVYKDLLLAVAALYHTTFANSLCVSASVCLHHFIGWKYCSTQKSPAKKGVGKKTFAEELREYDPNLEQYQIGLDGQNLKSIPPQNSLDLVKSQQINQQYQSNSLLIDNEQTTKQKDKQPKK